MRTGGNDKKKNNKKPDNLRLFVYDPLINILSKVHLCWDYIQTSYKHMNKKKKMYFRSYTTAAL